MNLRLFLASLAIGSFGCSSADDTCQPIGCPPSLTVDLHTADGKRFADDFYTVKVEIAGSVTNVTCFISASPTSAACKGGDANVNVYVSSDGTVISMTLRDGPPKVSVTLEASGKKLAEQTITPAYTSGAAGGRAGCPICQHATSTVTVGA